MYTEIYEVKMDSMKRRHLDFYPHMANLFFGRFTGEI